VVELQNNCIEKKCCARSSLRIFQPLKHTLVASLTQRRIKKMNNGTPHDYSIQEYACDLTGCTFYFDNHTSNTNKIRATCRGKNILLFSIEERTDSVEIYVTIPDNFHCIHYKNGTSTKKYRSKNAHLTYHGKPKRKKITGEIHIKNDGLNTFKGEVDKTEAPVASSSNIEIHPLPICRIELSESIGSVTPQNNIFNYFEVQSEACFFNTIEVHLARRGYMNNIASVTRNIPDIYASLFIHTSMHAFYLDKLERRPGLFPQALALQIEKFELIILATHEYKNSSYDSNSVRYFYTKDYFQSLSSRNIIQHMDGWFVDQSSKLPPKDGSYKLITLLNK